MNTRVLIPIEIILSITMNNRPTCPQPQLPPQTHSRFSPSSPIKQNINHRPFCPLLSYSPNSTVLTQSLSNFTTSAECQMPTFAVKSPHPVSKWQVSDSKTRDLRYRDEKIVDRTPPIQSKLCGSMQMIGETLPCSVRGLKTKIRFSYKQASKVDCCGSSLKTIVVEAPRGECETDRRGRNKLSSKEFQFKYLPPEKKGRSFDDIRNTNKELKKLLLTLMQESDLLTSKTSIHCTRDSKLTDTTLGEIDDSILDPSRKFSTLSHQPHHRPSLADHLSSAKHLDKTIMFSPSYDFGGLFQPGTACQQTPLCLLPQGLREGWKDVKNLLGEGSDMKESIHCGPEERSREWGCEMLRGLGRDLLESVMTVQE